MASGLPVVATSVDGTVELVEDGNTGYLVEPKQPKALVDKISALLESSEKCRAFGKAGREKVENEYSLNLQVNNFQNLYEKYAMNGAVKHSNAKRKLQ